MKVRGTPLSPADPALSRELRDFARQVKQISEGRLSGTVNAYTAAPTTGTWAQGDFVRNSRPEFVITAPDEGYIIKGWTCVEGGTPGIWVEERQAVHAVPPPPTPAPPSPSPSPSPSPAPAPATNLLLWSEDFSNSVWAASMTPALATNVSNDPNGNATVDEATFNLTTGQWKRQEITGLTIGQTYTLSILAQQGRTGSALAIRVTTNNLEAWNTGASTKHTLTSSLTAVSVTWTQTGTTTAALMIGAVGADGVGDADCVGTVRIAWAALNVGTSRNYVKTEGPASAPAPAPAPASQKVQAENAAVTGGLTTSTEIAGYEGTSHLNWLTNTSQTITATFTGVAAGSYNLRIRYANWNLQYEDLVLNGAAPTTLTMEGTGGTWVVKTIPVTLVAGTNTVKLQMNYGYSFYDYFEIVSTASAPAPAPSPAPAPAPSTALPSKVLACYYETYAGSSPAITDIPTDFNLVFIFHAKPNVPTATASALGWRLNNQGNGSFRFYDTGVVTASQVATMRGRGQLVSLTVGGKDAGYAFDTRAKSQNFVASFQDMYAEFGALDGCDFNNYEAGITPSITEMVWIAGRLKELYGNNFICSTPAGPNYTFDQDMCRAMMDAGVLDIANPQYYDWSGYREEGFVRIRNNREWVRGVARGDASRIVVGLSANYANGLSLSECIREYDAIKAEYPAIRGAFCWNAQTNIAGGNLWGSTMKARL